MAVPYVYLGASEIRLETMPVMNQVKLVQGDKWLGVPCSAVAKWLRGLSLTQHLLLMALAPFPLLLTAILALHLLESTRPPENVVHERGLSTVRLLAPAAELGVAFRNPLHLNQLLETVLAQEAVAAVAIYDRAGEVIVKGGRAEVPERLVGPARVGFLGERDGRVSFVAPVMIIPAVVDDIAHASMQSGTRLPPVGASNTIGWVYVELDQGLSAAQDRPSLLLLALCLVLATLAYSVCLALRLARSVGGPVAGLVEAVRRMAAGDVEVNVPVDAACHELQALQEGVNTLGRAIANVRSSMQAKIEETTGQLIYQALHDPLTGLPNRRAFDRALEEAVMASRRASDQGALCFIDLDHFKVVNDAAGHAAGDALLREVARLIQQRLRAQDLICRFGGDEFALILRGCTREDAKRIAANLCEAIATLRFEWEGECFSLSGSFGLAHIDHDTHSTTEVLKAADAACYAAKRKGRNQVVVDRDES